MEHYESLVNKAERIQARIKRLALIRELIQAEIDSSQTDLDALQLQLKVERYEGKHEEPK